ncbi:MAG: ABC-F family ATP-binding cassette domain-containing protein, partial [Clostridia bacterium]|nr:ABC-F family ATP-binding cassette domain-containing protein [Clostridia bacterium]
MTILSVDDLGLSFGTDVILEHISFAIEETDKLGIIGVNGSGKSSLFRMITGEYEPTEGRVYISKDKTLGILTQDGAFESESGDGTALSLMYHAFPHLLAAEKRLAELENALEDTSRTDYEVLTGEYTRLHERFIREGGMEFRGRCASILQKLGFDRADGERSVATFSGGQRTRLALAVVLAREPDLLLLDEPTNHLDMETLSWLESFLVSYKKCVMVISHDRYFLDRVTNKTLVVENCHAKLYKGNYTQTMQTREQDRALQQKKYDLQQREFARQEAFLEQQRRWNQAHNYVT